MKKKQLFTFLVIAISFAACQPEGEVYVEHQELSPNLEWLKKNAREFKVAVKNTDASYDLSLSFRYATGYQFKVAKVKVTEISPSGEETVKEYELKVKNEKGEYIGEPGLDIWDSEHLVEENKKYKEEGTYTYVIEHVMPQNPLNFAMEIGVILDETK